MEILATHLPSTRGPVEVQRAEFETLLRPGRVLAGVVSEVTPTEALLKIGRHTLAAKAHPGLEAGQQLLLQVTGETSTEGILLKLLGPRAGPESGLLRALRSVVGADRPLGELLQSLGRRLAALEAHRPGASSGLTERLSAHVFQPGSGGEALMRLLARGGLSYESALLEAATRSTTPEAAHALLLDLKAELLAQLDKLAPGPGREAVALALAGLEAEQLLNVARKEAGEPMHWSFAVPDGSHWTTAHLLWRSARDSEDDAQAGEGGTQRLSLGIEFSNTGPVRVDAWLRPDTLSLRILVEREEVASLIRAGSEVLARALEVAGRSVRIVVGVGSPEQVEIEARSLDIRYLREHHLMDVSG